MTGVGEGGVEGRFAAAMAAAAPFEPEPLLAVALSGGADSTALLLLAEAWARARGGRVLALIVDHALRAGSAEEAAATAQACAARGIAHRVLAWAGPRPARRIQERAREARYALLERACREEGILHLLVGHHADDQAETIAMRRARRSGPPGLAGMALDTPRLHARILRPLLGMPAAALRAWLVEAGASWIEDPSNRDPRFLRARMRLGAGQGVVPDAPGPGGAPTQPRAVADSALADWLGRHAAVHPEGWIDLEGPEFGRLDPTVAGAVLRAATMAVAGAVHPPRGEALRQAVAWSLGAMPAGARRCFAGCVLLRRASGLAILRDPALPRAAALPRGEGEFLWDRRFRIRMAAQAGCDEAILPLGRLPGTAPPRGRGAAATASRVLPVLQSLDGCWRMPHLLGGRGSVALVSVPEIDVTFRPARKLAGGAFAGLPAAGPIATQASRRPPPRDRRRRSPEREPPP